MKLGPLLALALALAAGGREAAAQASSGTSLEAFPVQGLAFGPMIPGVPESIPVTDGARRAEIVITGQGTADVTLVLPEALVSAAGARIPLRFGARDAAVARGSGAAVPVDPHQPIRVSLDGASGPVRILVGATALPAPGQVAGTYTTTLVLVVVNPGT
ncbi:MAG: hypothetical protein JWM27_2438 [Gemmatimonadetes bacterium]|nr:hypothetical protein [Gemmatimonadota bacterium]